MKFATTPQHTHGLFTRVEYAVQQSDRAYNATPGGGFNLPRYITCFTLPSVLCMSLTFFVMLIPTGILKNLLLDYVFPHTKHVLLL